MHDNTLTDDNRDKFSYIAGRYGQQIKFYNVEKICANEIESFQTLMSAGTKRKYSIGSIYRFLIPKIFPEEMTKIIYLDSDIIVNLDIGELWRVELGDKPIAAFNEIEINSHLKDGLYSDRNVNLCSDGFAEISDYFNSGVLIIDVKKFCEDEQSNIERGIKFISANPRYNLFDQDVLNYCFSKNHVKLPMRFNFFVRENRESGNNKIGRCIFHYMNSNSLLKLDMRDNFNRLWFSYFEKTPWFNKDTLAHINEGIVQLHVNLKDFAARITALMAGKERGFFVIAPSVDAIKKTFYVRDNEEIIPAVNQESFMQLINSMKEAGGKKMYFIFAGAAYGGVRVELTKAGFVEGRDFIDASNFLSELHGAPLDTNSFIKLL